MLLPRKVFLESNILFKLGPRLENVDFVELLQLRDSLKFDLSVAEVSWREYLRQREKEIRECLARIRQCRGDLSKHDQQSDELEKAEEKVLVHLGNLARHFGAKAQNLGITVVPLPLVDVRQLLEMSLACDPPFEETKEKGFRDALIMFTVLENIAKHPEDNALVITDDKRLTEGLRLQAPKFQTQLSVAASLQEAVLQIYNGLSVSYRERRRREADEAKNMLLKYRNEISESVQQVRELTEDDLGQGVLAGFFGEERLKVEKLESLTFDDVESALWKDADQNRSRILFKLRCLAKVIVSPQPSFLRWSPTTFVVGGGNGQTCKCRVSIPCPQLRKN
jgi:hypothetical protein